LTSKQRRFVEEYVIDFNGTKAAIRAGYSPRTANEQAAALLAKPSISDEVERLKEWHATKSGITKDRVLRELAAMAFSSISNYRIDDAGNLTLSPGAPRNAMAAVSSIKRKAWDDGEGGHTVEVEFKLWGKAEPLKLVGRHVDLKGVSERVEHSGPDGGPIKYEEMTVEEKRARLKALAETATARLAEEGAKDGGSGS